MNSAYLYSVMIHPMRKPNEVRQLGDYAGQGGRWIGDNIAAALMTVAPTPPAPPNPAADPADEVDVVTVTSTTTYESVSVNGDIVGATFLIEEFGSHGEMRLASVGPDAVARVAADSQRQRAGVVFSLPRSKNDGVVAIQRVDGRRSALTAVRAAVRRCAPDVLVEIRPLVDTDAFYAAIEQDRVLEVVLTEPVADNGVFTATAAGTANNRVLVKNSVRTEGSGFVVLNGLKQLANRLRLGQETTLKIADREYEDISVKVKMASGLERTVSLGTPDEGWPIAAGLTFVATPEDDALGGSPSSVLAALHAAIVNTV